MSEIHKVHFNSRAPVVPKTKKVSSRADGALLYWSQDTELFEILVRPLPSGCRLTCLMDCCHSGGVAGIFMANRSKQLIKDSSYRWNADSFAGPKFLKYLGSTNLDQRHVYQKPNGSPMDPHVFPNFKFVKFFPTAQGLSLSTRS